uniref:Uncharacterized protein n=1 Tax=Microviridae sp. ctatW3 TaxID=2825001 RepID=A0A8S5R3N9_9VIRU|nr:MAG TPA: hypothetical protein [Microviridae sp. ctatW3]
MIQLMLVQPNSFSSIYCLIQKVLIMKWFIKILKVLEIALPFLKSLVESLSKDKDKKQDNV